MGYYATQRSVHYQLADRPLSCLCSGKGHHCSGKLEAVNCTTFNKILDFHGKKYCDILLKCSLVYDSVVCLPMESGVLSTLASDTKRIEHKCHFSLLCLPLPLCDR